MPFSDKNFFNPNSNLIADKLDTTLTWMILRRIRKVVFFINQNYFFTVGIDFNFHFWRIFFEITEEHNLYFCLKLKMNENQENVKSTFQPLRWLSVLLFFHWHSTKLYWERDGGWKKWLKIALNRIRLSYKRDLVSFVCLSLFFCLSVSF